ncbi:MAG TPA: PilZ domain-containing protein [Desulfobacteraceae bacterium]|nr:PilZ domain-containing protein [Desulfobacteraceae bacterium]
MSPENRREYLRTDVLISARIRVLNQEELSLLEQGDTTILEGNVFSSPIDEIIDQVPTGSKEETLYRCLKMMDKKLNFVIEQMTTPPDQPGRALNEIVELSGSGLRFLSETFYPENTPLKIDLIMPGTFEFKVTLIAKVIRIDKRETTGRAGTESYSIAVHFTEIDEKARDAIIETIFRKQRKLIRLEKERKGE